MRPEPPALVERIIAALRRGPAPRSSADLAREFLGLGLLDERAAARVLDPVLERERRLERTPGGWSVRESHSTRAASDPPLAAARIALFAPRRPPVGAIARGDGGAARYAVAVGGEAEAERAVARGLLERVPRPVVDLGTLARRWRGYRGPRDPLAIAAHSGCRVVDGGTPRSMAEAVAACWSAFIGQLALEDVTHASDVARLLEQRLEAADFAGKQFGPSDLDALPAAPGVYEFAGGDGRVLYVGQSSCLAVRVRSYFTGPPRDGKDRALRVDATTLNVRRASSAPGALIDEMRRIEHLRPALNARRPAGTEGAEDGIVLAPRYGSSDAAPAGWAWFAISGGRLAGRGSLLPGPRRARESARRAVGALTAPPAPGGGSADGARREAVLVDAWRRARTDAPWLRLAVDGSEADLVEMLARLAGRSPADPAR